MWLVFYWNQKFLTLKETVLYFRRTSKLLRLHLNPKLWNLLQNCVRRYESVPGRHFSSTCGDFYNSWLAVNESSYWNKSSFPLIYKGFSACFTGCFCLFSAWSSFMELDRSVEILSAFFFWTEREKDENGI